MTSQDKLIKQGIKYTDRLFDEISKRIEKGVRKSDTLEEFLVQYHKAFPEKGNPLVSLGYDKEMLNIILSETNNHKFSKPAQKELVRITVNDRVGDLIVDVGDDVKESVREIVRDGYDNNLSQDEIAENISNRVGVIKNKRARAIARTEIARTATISDYIVNKERGATGWYVECRNTACKVCKNAWHKGWSEETDASFTPNDTSAGGKGWIGDRIFSMNDTSMLPPVHPSCRCVVYYTHEEPNVSTEPVQQTTSTTVEEPTKETVEEDITASLTEKERKRYFKLQKSIEKSNKMLDKLAPDDPRRIMYEHRLKSDRKNMERLENIASNPTNRKTVEEHVIRKGDKKNSKLTYEQISTYEEIADYFGLTYIEEVTSQYGKETRRPLLRDEKYNVRFVGMDSFDPIETKEVLRSYDRANPLLKTSTTSIFMDYTTDKKTLGECNPASNSITIYTHKWDNDPASLEYTTNHEMTHAFDNFLNQNYEKHFSQESTEYRKLVREEGWSSNYSYSTKGSTRIMEDFAETGAMVLNKNNPNIRIRLQDDTIITAKEWCERFPKKTAFFEELLNSKEAQKLLNN